MTGERRAGRRRWPWVVAAMALTLLAIGAFVWFVWLPNHRPDLRPGERLGVDVSRHQGTIDWPAVAADDVDFAYIKASEGGDLVDTRFAENWKGANAAGLQRGAYHYFTLCRPGRDQGENFLRTVPYDPHALPPAVDLEIAGNCSQRPSAAAVARELRDFVNTVEAGTGRKLVLYVGDDFERRYPVALRPGRRIWARRMHRRPLSDGWWLWQFSGTSRVDGVHGHVDLNVMQPSDPS